MIDLRHVAKVFNKGRSNECVAVSDVSLTLESGGITVLRGPSGSGKTTILSIIGAMTRPTAGRVEVLGHEITSLPERFLTEIRRKTFGFIFQQFNLIKGMTALENVMIPAYPEGEKHASLRRRALDLLALCEMSHRASSKVEWLSGGEAQRVAIARAVINNPRVVIADEPTAHLDTNLSTQFMAAMERLEKEGKTIIIASHDPIVFSAPAVRAVLEVRDGRVVPTVGRP